MPQTVADLLLTQDRMTGVSVLDSALRQGRLPGAANSATAGAAGGKRAVLTLLRGRTGAPRARVWLAEGDGRAESPLETRHRLICTDAGMAPEVLQWRLADPHTGTRYRVDAGWPSRGIGVEADGEEVHSRPQAVYADRHRQNALLAAYPGLVLLRFTWQDALRPARFLDQLGQALRLRSRSTEMTFPAPGGG
ncbi:hypothetical protein LHJ74_06315 [Streptomyces sp. N2-109]|uniref:DUF559 domain-containing protein n=1 Tax=Streptomyces gossypii TaxID=2883101 RepID=A0ABT2JQ91_9ACTN|nr:hypothetical protein [Streptomyces gossypii]MCT2589540.1 hypothetical protein [Streptomyces gossypii]